MAVFIKISSCSLLILMTFLFLLWYSYARPFICNQPQYIIETLKFGETVLKYRVQSSFLQSINKDISVHPHNSESPISCLQKTFPWSLLIAKVLFFTHLAGRCNLSPTTNLQSCFIFFLPDILGWIKDPLLGAVPFVKRIQTMPWLLSILKWVDIYKFPAVFMCVRETTVVQNLVQCVFFFLLYLEPNFYCHFPLNIAP